MAAHAVNRDDAGHGPQRTKPAAPAPLGPGAPAPSLTLPDTHGSPLALVASARPLLVVFLPVAFSPVCGGEVRELAAAVEGGTLGADVVGISCDSMFALRAWAATEDAGFALVSDFWPHGRAARAYGVLDEDTGRPLRASFLLAGGTVRWRVVNPGGTPRPVANYHQAIAAL